MGMCSTCEYEKKKCPSHCDHNYKAWVRKGELQVKKSCDNCRFTDCHASTVETCKEKEYEWWEEKENIAGVGTDAPIVTNSQGGKQSKIDTAFSLIPHDALVAVAKVMKVGSERYAKDNWRKLSTDEIYDHLMEHLVNWHMTGNMEDLEHAITRGMMLYSVANKEG